MKNCLPLWIAFVVSGGILVLLVSCASAPPGRICPHIVPYTPDEQHALAAELRAHRDLVEVPRFIGDYIGLRDQVRACEKSR